MVPSSPAPRYYLIGAILAGLGALLLAVRGFLAKRSRRPSRPLLIVAVVALAAGVTVFGAGWWMDMQFTRDQNTNTLTYELSVRMNGTGPVTLLLPAPVDARFYPDLNATKGSSTLRVTSTASGAAVVVVAYGNVTFQVQAAVYPGGNDSYTRVALPSSPYLDNHSNASIALNAADPNATALVTLYASIYGACQTHYLTVDATVHVGVAMYAARYGFAFC